jgi:pimeloyl-ACP methyl ester carboxylesterase
MTDQIKFKTGMYDFHKNPNINYQLNRAVNWGNGDYELVKKIAKESTSIEALIENSYKRAVECEKNLELDNAIACYRLAEFFLNSKDKRKIISYKKALNLFNLKNKKNFEEKKEFLIKKEFVNYYNKQIPYYLFNPKVKEKDTIIIHGGFDSYMEEFFNASKYLMQRGYKVILFDGPGQGYANRIEKIPFTHKWEEIIIKIHDELKLKNTIIIGFSLGAMLAPRAAAYEKRIKKIVSVGVMHDFFEVLISSKNKKVQKIIKTLINFKQKKLINFIMEKMMKKDLLAKWGIRHGMEIFNSNTPYDFLKDSKKYNIKDIENKITQDVLIVTGSEDHFVPIKMLDNMYKCFSNSKSVTIQVFNDYAAKNHCQVGNCKLLMDNIIKWLE